jgi:serine/threonine-protein kinase RsbW/stage II sporulation protein AB (anti-sigma F factor)
MFNKVTVGVDGQAGGSNGLVLRVPARADQIGVVRHAIAAFGRAQGVADLGALVLAVTEAVTNTVVHAYIDADTPGDVEVVAHRRSNGSIDVDVSDDGRGMQPRPESPGFDVGLPLISSLATHVHVEATELGGTHIRMNFAPRRSRRVRGPEQSR